MGIDVNGTAFLCYAAAEGVSFERTATLGRQSLNVTPAMLRATLRRFGRQSELQTRLGDYAEPLFELLGASRVDSFDASGYEGGTFVHDLNVPIPDEWKNRYTAVLDGGTLEHVFDFPRAIASAMQMTELGGHYLGITPTNNFSGHGFYQFSPELYFRIFSPANGFTMVRMLMYRDSPRATWYEVADPGEIGKRVTLEGCQPAYLAVLAKRTALIQPFTTPPLQSDYESQWRATTAPGHDWKATPLIHSIYRRVPGMLKRFLRRDRRFFRRVDLTTLPSRR